MAHILLDQLSSLFGIFVPASGTSIIFLLIIPPYSSIGLIGVWACGSTSNAGLLSN